MITKTKPAGSVYAYYYDGYGSNRTSVSTGAATITYEEGPRFSQGRCNWKRCTANSTRSLSPSSVCGEYDVSLYRESHVNIYCPPATSVPSCPSMPTDFSAVKSELISQLDLNCHDSVLLYSNVVQAIPLVGACFKFTSVLNRAARVLSKSFKNKPFSTVVKQLIQMDFIDRFVIKPTLDDGRKFINATNYCLSVIEEAYRRNGRFPTAFRSSAIHTITSSSGSAKNRSSYRDNVTVNYDYSQSQSQTTSLYMLTNVSYNTSAIKPIKLALARYGITRPLEAAWDLLPFSFVLDYFLRIGDFISDLSNEMTDQSALRGKLVGIPSIWATAKAEGMREHSVTGFTSANTLYNKQSYPGASSTMSSKSFSRYPIENPYGFLSSVESSRDFISFDLSRTQVRTLAELVIQAKLR